MARSFLLFLIIPALLVVSQTIAMHPNMTKPAELVSDGNVMYHMGPVISPNITIHIIWYGRWKPEHKRLIREFINSFSAPNRRSSPTVSDWWKIVQMYTDQTGSNVTRTVTLGREKNYHFLSQGKILNRLSMQYVIRAAISAKTNPLPIHPEGGIYLVLTADDIQVREFCVTACGFHYFTFPSVVGYTLPFAWVGNSEKFCPGFCAYPFAVPAYARNLAKPLKSPNGEVGVDGMISVIAHEIAELATNPLVNAWYAGNDPAEPTEVADLCIGKYGTGGAGVYIGKVHRDANGAVYNVRGIRRRFLVQWVWSYLENKCVGPN